ncbi:MAG: DNA internalization-related competence protein ComEC/Rec2 [Candidatus Gastranaerophilales bacterium]|nr:DNA internalization-related competence protein ComEC/Rec2 [Candidatus Gastranaerophilales bacterium]
MKKIFGDLLQSKNTLMFAAVMSYIFGLFAYFCDKPILFAGVFTAVSVFLLIKNLPAKFVMLWIFIFYFGFFNANLRIKNSDELFKIAPADGTVCGQIVSIPNSNIQNNSKFFFVTDKIKLNNGQVKTLSNKVLVSLNCPKSDNDFSNLLIGNYYEIQGKLRKPFKASNPSQFSYGSYLRNFQTYTLFYADKADVKPIKHELSAKWKVIQYLNTKRNSILKTHSKYLKSPNIEILGGIVFGDDAVAPPDYIKTTFINSGLLHILAASGMNVAFISTFLFFFLRRLNVPYNIRIISGIFVVILYCLMTGLGASVIRAALMLIFILLGKLIDRDAHSVALLSFVGLLMLIYNPAYINDVGFQLSFIVTFGIIVSAEPVLQYTKRLPLLISTAVFIPVIAQIWVIPVQMFYFNTISTYSFFANIVSMPFLSVISFGGFVSSVFSLFTPVADLVCHIFDFVLKPMLDILVCISTFFAELPHSLIITTHPSILQVLLYYIILSLIIVLLKIRFNNKKLCLSVAALTVILILSATMHIPNHNFEVIAFDVGNADAFLLKTPQNKYFIIDTGKSGYMGRRSQADIIILKYLKDKGIKNIEGLIVTHFDDDHAGGSIDIIKNLKVKNVYLNSLNDDKRLAKRIYKAIDNKKDTDKIIAKNNRIIYSEDGFEMRTYMAELPKNGHDSCENENSVITLVRHGKMSMLFTGDAGVRAYNRIKTKLPPNITVLKVGHHGAGNVVNKEMMAYLNPEVSIVSVGYNRYGHPHPMTMKLISSSKVMRTDKINSIKVISNKHGYEVDGFDSRTRKYYRRLKKEYR